MKKLNELQSYLTRLRGLMLTLIILCSIGIGNVWGASATWVLVESEPSDWSGEYLIVYNSNCFDGSLTSGFNGNAGQSVSISNKQITKDDSYSLTVSKVSGKYYLQTASGYYIGRKANSNGVDANTSRTTDYVVTFSSWNGTNKTVKIAGTGGRCLGNNSGSWKFFSSGNTYVNVSLYKKSAAASHTLSSAVSPAGYGTVALSATSVVEGSTATATATANTGYVFSSWSISGTGASLSSTTDNPTTVTMGTANATVTANFAAKTAASISFVNAGTPAPTTSGYYVGDSYTLPSTNNYSCNGKTFVGWSTVPVAETDIKPTSNFYEPGASATLAASQTFYAVFASVTEGTGDWEQCSSSTIADGDYLIVQSDYMMTNTLNSQRFNRTYIAISAGVISYDAKADWSAYTWHIAETSTSGIFTIKNGNNYVIGTGTASKIDLVSTPADDKELFAITYQSTPGTYKIVSKYNEAADVNRWLRNGGSYFACYADGSYPYLFKRGNGYGNYCTTCAVTHTVSSAVDPTGKATVTLGATTVAEDATTTAEYSGITTGYEFVNWSISGTGATLSSTTSNPTTITMGTANVTVTANLRCITPTFSAHPASKTDYIVGDVATALSVTANAGGASLSYQWQVSNNNSDWSNIAAGDGGTAATYTPSTAAAGTKYYRVKVTNAATGCSTNATSNAATITVTAASYFTNEATVFVQAESSSAWDASACVKAWFNASGAGGAAQTTYWLFDATDGDAGKKLYATIVPASGDLNQVTLQRFASNCSDFWNNNGTLTKASDGGSNTFRSTGSGTSNVAWNGSGMTLDLKGDPNSWGSSLGTFADQGNGVWTATYEDYAPANAAGESQEFKISTNYNGWIGNTGSNNNATLDGMHVGSTYNITATLDVKDHSLTMSKTFVKGTVHFDMQGHGSSIADLTNITAGSKISAPGTPSATGWDFGGWFKEPACTNAWDFANDVVNETMTLYAKWTKHTYTITSTLNNCSSSPAIPSSYEYTGSAASLSYTITPSSGYRLPTTITVSGTTYTWNSTTGALVLTGTIASNVTITISAVQTHTVDWYVGGSAPANKIDDDGQTTVVDHGGKISDFPATTPDGSACDKTFVGWTNTSSYVHGTSPLFNDVAGSPTINADANFYAVFATGGGDDFELVTAVSQLHVGDVVTIANFVGNSESGAVIKAYNSGNNWPEASASTDASGKISGSTTDMQTFTLEEGSVDDTWAFNDGTGYPYAASSGSNHMKRETTLSGNSSFSITIDGTSHAAAIVAQGTNTRNTMRYNSSSSIFSCYDPVNSQSDIYIYRKPSATGHTITCADCGTSVTPTYTASPTGGTVSVTKSAAAVASGSTVKTCTSVDLTVTITPASHYTLTGFTATGLSTGTATISPAVNTVVPTTSEQTFTVTVSAGATGTLNLTPTFTEDTKVAITWNVNGVNQSIAATEGLTWVYSGEDLTALPSTPSVPAGCTGTKVFAGWSQKHSDATEQDAAWYDDLFDAYNDPTVPTGITSAKTFYAVFATSSSNPLAGTVMWDEPWTGTSDKTTPTSPSSGATVYNSTVLTYAYTNGNTTTQVYADGTMYSGGAAAPELLISKTSPSGVWTVTNIPTGGSAQTELTLSYKTNRTTIEVTSGTSGITIGDPTVDGNTYTHTITINHSPSTINNFSLIFTNTGSSNARLDDIHLVVPGSGTMTDYVTLCAPSYTITYNKNTSDPVTNLPSPTSVLQSTGSGTLSSTIPVRATYTFVGWSNASGDDNTKNYDAGGSITGVTADKTIYAVWEKTAVEELTLNYSELNKYVGDPAVTLEVTGVTPEGADASVTWSSNNTSVASVVAATGVVTFGTVGTATITATSTVTGTTNAYCYVTVRNKPTATFVDLIHDGNGTTLSDYNLQDVAGTAIVFPTLDDYATPGDDCDSKHYVFVGWTTSDNNDDPEDHLVTSDVLEDDQAKTFYAVWADGVAGVSYTKMSNNSFKTSPTKYVIGAIDGDDTFYFYSCAATDANNGNGGCTNAPGTNAPIQFTLSGTADALVATSTEAPARYLTPLTAKNFQMSATSKTIQLNDDGTIANPSDDSWTLRFNTSEDYLRWYSSETGNAAYFYEVTAGAAVSYRTSCCTNNVPAPTVIATNTAYTVTLTWAAVDGATGYEVSWNGGAFTAATSPCVKSGLTASTDYTYKVRATYDPLVKCGALVASGSVTTDDVYSVTYSGGTGTGSCSPSGSVATVSYEAGATVTLAPTNSFSLTSNTFAAWVVKDADDNDVPVSNNQFTMPAKNVTVTATWTAVQDKYYDRMHDGTDDSHGGIPDGEGKYYLVLEGCNYTVPTLTDDDDGDTECHTTHFKLLGWIAYSHLKTDGSGEIKPGEESYIFQGGGTKSATGATYYAIWAIMTE